VPNAFRDHEALTWSELDYAIFQIHDEAALDDVEELIFVVVMMPMVVALLEDAESHDRVVHLAQGLIVPRVRDLPDERIEIDDLQRCVVNVQTCIVACRISVAHGTPRSFEVDFDSLPQRTQRTQRNNFFVVVLDLLCVLCVLCGSSSY